LSQSIGDLETQHPLRARSTTCGMLLARYLSLPYKAIVCSSQEHATPHICNPLKSLCITFAMTSALCTALGSP